MRVTLQGKSADFGTNVKGYASDWSKQMVIIWKDRLQQLGVYNTGRLQSSVQLSNMLTSDTSAELYFNFLEYGIYQDVGTGYGFKKNNGGDLPFLGDAYREEHNLNEPRKRGPRWGGGYTSGFPRVKRPWFSISWRISQRVMADAMQRIIGDSFVALFDSL